MDIVGEEVNVLLLVLLGELLAVLLVVALVLVVMLWLVDGDAVIETVPEDVSDELVVADTLPVWDGLVVGLWDDDTVKLRLTDKECDADAVIDNDEDLLAEMLLVVVQLGLIVWVALVLDDSLGDGDREGVTDAVDVSDTDIVDDIEALRDIELVSC